MKVYVDELPNSCASCKFCTSDYYCKLMLKDIFDYDKPINRQGRYSKCRLKTLSDYTKQVKNEVCEEIRTFAYDTFKEFGCFDETDLEHILDQIQGKGE